MRIPLLLTWSALLLSMPGHSGDTRKPAASSAFYIVVQGFQDACPCWDDTILDVRPSPAGMIVRKIEIIPVPGMCKEVVTLQGAEREVPGSKIDELAAGTALCAVHQADVNRAIRKAGWTRRPIFAGESFGIVTHCLDSPRVLHLPYIGHFRFDRMQANSPELAALWGLARQVDERALLASAEKRNLVDGMARLDPWAEEVRSGCFDAAFGNSCESRLPESFYPKWLRSSQRAACDPHPGATELAREGGPFAEALSTTIQVRGTVEVRGTTFVNFVQPEYPVLAKMTRIQGPVKVALSVDPAGNVTDARIISGHPLFTQTTLAAARQWRVSVDSTQAARTIEVLVDYRFPLECP